MSYSIKRQEQPKALIATFNPDFDFDTEAEQYDADLLSALDAETQPVTVIINILNVRIDFNSLLKSTGSSKNSPNSNPAQHPKTAMLILVTDNKLMKASLDGFKKLGIAKNIAIYHTEAEALQSLT